MVPFGREIKTIEIEGNQYFPPDSINQQFLEDSDMHSTCPWKGEVSYYHVVVNNEKILMLPGIILIPKILQPRSRTMFRSGRVLSFPEKTLR